MINHPNRPRKRAAPAATSAPAHNHDDDYIALRTAISNRFACFSGEPVLFNTDADSDTLYAAYLDNLPGERQVHNCHACRRFIEQYGTLVDVDTMGRQHSVMWHAASAPGFYRDAFGAMAHIAERARITGPFYCKETTWGTPRTGPWTHMAVQPPAALVHRERLLTAGQAMAAARENLRVVREALANFQPKLLDQALQLIEGEHLNMSERFVGPLRWLRGLHDLPRGRNGANLLWRAVALVPEGYCHPRAGVIGWLIEDLRAGLPFEEVKGRFNAKVAPLTYQRPKAAPTTGNIRQAEAAFEKLGLARSLERRYALAGEVEAIWWSACTETLKGQAGLFGHLTPKGAAPPLVFSVPTSTLTWAKFRATVLPRAAHLRLKVPSHGHFIALTTAVHADAPPILKWDHEQERNALAWYVYPGGSPARQWGLAPGWATVEAVAPLPPMLGAHPAPHLGEGAVLIIEGARDSRDAGNALFPSCLRDDLHGVRATIEAYSCGAKLGRPAGQLASGYDVRSSSAKCTLAACVNGAWATYDIDRWD